MIISNKFVVGHIPKTGGHALAVLLSQIESLKFDSPFKIEQGRAQINEELETLHKPFEELDSSFLRNKDLILVIRRLPSWWFSILWHHSIHTQLNIKLGVEKKNIRSVYTDEFKDAVPSVLLLPEITCKTCYPDWKLKEIGGKYLRRIVWFRMETLAEDLLSYLRKKRIKVTAEEKDRILAVPKSTHSYLTQPTRYRYFPENELKVLYECNPKWRDLEQKLYGNIVQKYDSSLINPEVLKKL